jgi:hypothetical protein
MKSVVFAPKDSPEVRRPTIAQQPPQSLIFAGWGPRMTA